MQEPSGCTQVAAPHPGPSRGKGLSRCSRGHPARKHGTWQSPPEVTAKCHVASWVGFWGKTQSQVGPTVTHDVHHVARPRPGSSLCYPCNFCGNLKSSNYKRSKTRPGPDVFTCEFTKHEEPAALLKLWDKLKNISSLILGGQHYPDIKPRQRHHKKNDRPISLMSITGKVLKKMPAE